MKKEIKNNYNTLCLRCKNSRKQDIRNVIIKCPLFEEKSKKDILMMTLIFTLLFSLSAFAQEIDLNALAQVESSNNPKAVSFLGVKYGRGWLQVSEVALADYNASHSHKIAPESLFDKETNIRVASWYITRLKRYLRHYGVEVNLENLLSAYNLGAKSVANGKRADRYIEKYYKALK